MSETEIMEEIIPCLKHKFTEWMVGKQCVQKYTYAFRICKVCGKTERVRLDCEHKNQFLYIRASDKETFIVCEDCGRKL